MKKLFFISLVLLWVLSACTASDDRQVQFNPTIVADEVCSGLLNNTFITSDNLQISGEEDSQSLLPLRVSFLLDGRVIWNYEDNASYIGTFTCDNGSVTARFTEGSSQEFTGDYDPAAGAIVIQGITYLVDTDI